MLVVERTGWGKSAVYFIATRLLRDQGAGPTVLVSPLLALMRNHGGSGVTLFSYNKVTDVVTKVGPLFDPESKYYEKA